MIKATSNLKVHDRGLASIMLELRETDERFVKVGLPENGEVETMGDSDVVKMSELVGIGAYNEFGTHRIPARPFMSTSYDSSLPELKRLRDRLYERILDGKETAVGALKKMGVFMVGKTQKQIKDIMHPENAESTKKKKKGVNNPLIDTGTMRQSIQFVEGRKNVTA